MAPPTIFSPARRLAARRRALRLRQFPDAPDYLHRDMAEDVLERLGFVRHAPGRSLAVGDWSGLLARSLPQLTEAEPADGFDEEQPYPLGDFEFIASLGTLDTVNDLPGALVHIRNALAPGGLAIVSFVGAGSLPRLRSAMLAADGDRPAPRLHPMVDVRAGAQLMQRAGFRDPVCDSRSLSVRFSSLDRLVGDLRGQGASNVLARSGPPLTAAGRDRARRSFSASTEERFEILTLTGWR